MEVVLEAGADDVIAPEGDGDDKGMWTIMTDVGEFQAVKVALEAAQIEIVEAEIARIPDNTIEVAGDDVRKLLNLIEVLEELDDVQKVYSNGDMDGDELAKL